MANDAPHSRLEQVLGRRVRDYRTVKGWNQDDLAEKMSALGFSWTQSTVTRTESASRPIRVDEAAALADLFGVRVEDLLRDAADPLGDRKRAVAFRRASLLRELKIVQSGAEELMAELETLNRQAEVMDAVTEATKRGDISEINEAVDRFTEVFGPVETAAILAASGLGEVPT